MRRGAPSSYKPSAGVQPAERTDMNTSSSAGFHAYQIRDILAHGEIGSIFVDPENPDSYMAGYVRAFNGRQLLMEAVNTWGGWDGFLAISMDAVLMVMSGDEYSERLERLVRLRRQPSRPLPEFIAEDHLIVALLRAAGDRVVSVWTQEGVTIGKVREVNDLFLTMTPLDFMGQALPALTLGVRSLLMVSLDSAEEQMFQLLSDQPLDARKDGQSEDLS